MRADPDASFADVEQLLATSTPARLIRRVPPLLRSAAADSKLLVPVRRARTRIRQVSATLRVRLAAVLVLSFVATHLALLPWIPLSTRPSMPLVFWMVIALAALTVAVGADRFVTAWRERRER